MKKGQVICIIEAMKLMNEIEVCVFPFLFVIVIVFSHILDIFVPFYKIILPYIVLYRNPCYINLAVNKSISTDLLLYCYLFQLH